MCLCTFVLSVTLYICQQSEVSLVKGAAQFVSSGVVEVNGEQYSANHILIATGGAPLMPNLPGTNFFALKLLNKLTSCKMYNLSKMYNKHVCHFVPVPT